MNSFKPTLTRLEGREVPATFLVNTEMDLPDINIGDGVALTALGTTSLRSVIQEVNASGPAAVGNGNGLPNANMHGPGTYQIEFANVHGLQFQNQTGLIVTPTPLTHMTLLLSSQLPALPAGFDYYINGSTSRG